MYKRQIEAIDAEIPLLVVITEGIPVQDTAYAWAYNVDHGRKTRIIGPNCPGIITPGQSNAGIIPADITKPVVGYVAGFTAPEGKTMGHAGAIVSGSAGTAAAKQEALEAVGVKVGKTPSEAARIMRELMS